MEFISSPLLNKYERIINEINSEFQKSQSLSNEIEELDNSIIIYNLLNSGQFNKLSHLDVKVFNNISEVLNIYQEEFVTSSIESLQGPSLKYYFIELYITKHLLEKIRRSDWKVVFLAKYDDINVSKTVNLPRKSCTIFDLIPLPQDVTDCSVEAYLIKTSSESLTIKLDSLDIDISYHFYKQKQKFENKSTKILQLTKIYNKMLDINITEQTYLLTYEINISISVENFSEIILKNSYNNLDIDLFADMNNDKGFTIQFSVGIGKIYVVFNRNMLQIKAYPGQIEKLKKYFLEQLPSKSKIPEDLSGLNEIRNSYLCNATDAINLYRNMRQVSSRLSV